MAKFPHPINMRRIATGLLFLCLAASAPVVRSQTPQTVAVSPTHSPYGEKIVVAGVPNVGKITDQLYRGAQPRPGSLPQLQKLGITTIVDLRSEYVAERDREKKEAESLGIRFVSIPVGGWSAPSGAQVAQFFSLFSDPKQKVFVHCRFGEDRTGVFVAAYRMAMQQWTAQQAIDEMHFFGYNSFWHHAMTSFVRSFPALLSSSPTFATLTNSKSATAAVATRPAATALAAPLN
jgi:protein tyrosine/serine phosphatase